MRIFMGSGHCYPARHGGMASDRLTDLAAKGFAELGHQVFYELRWGATESQPEGVELVNERRYDVDVMYLQRWQSPRTRDVPWVLTYHAPRKANDPMWPKVRGNWIFVSQTHARSFGRNRYVTNGIDPSEFIYSETKDDYFLFAVANLGDLKVKGYEIVQSLVRECGIKVIVAGAPPFGESADTYIRMFESQGVAYSGYVSGERKAELFARAKCLLFPTQQNEPFGLVVAEALVSGTPVISSDNGACPEIITPDVGIVCATMNDYKSAVEQIERIAPLACRTAALERYHYLRMARDYVSEFEKEIEVRLTGETREYWLELDRHGQHFTVGVLW
jgi:glycosyltransferase involved in cell wall biosynthesis